MILKTPYSVSLSRIMKEFSLESIVMPKNPDELFVSTAETNRPGLQLSGYYEFFDNDRIQVIGKSEDSFLYKFDENDYLRRIDALMAAEPPAVIITRGLPVSTVMIESARKHKVPLLRTDDATSSFISALIAYLNVHLAPRITRHGVLVEVYGEGILLLGESGVGKSETAIELVKRGHRLIADDAVEIRRVSSKSLVGSAPENIRHFIELRGIGIIDVKTLFGVEGVKEKQQIDLVIKLEDWKKDNEYDRLGLEEEYTEFLGNKVVCHSLPIRAGRNLAVICEAAAVNHRQKKMGYNAAQELYRRVQENLTKKSDDEEDE